MNDGYDCFTGGNHDEQRPVTEQLASQPGSNLDYRAVRDRHERDEPRDCRIDWLVTRPSEAFLPRSFQILRIDLGGNETGFIPKTARVEDGTDLADNTQLLQPSQTVENVFLL